MHYNNKDTSTGPIAASARIRIFKNAYFYANRVFVRVLNKLLHI